MVLKKDKSKQDCMSFTIITILAILKETIKSYDLRSGSKDEKINKFINNCKIILLLKVKFRHVF